MSRNGAFRHCVIAGAVAAAMLLPMAAAQAQPKHGIAMHGDLKYPPGFRQFDRSGSAAPRIRPDGHAVLATGRRLGPKKLVRQGFGPHRKRGQKQGNQQKSTNHAKHRSCQLTPGLDPE